MNVDHAVSLTISASELISRQAVQSHIPLPYVRTKPPYVVSCKVYMFPSISALQKKDIYEVNCVTLHVNIDNIWHFIY